MWERRAGHGGDHISDLSLNINCVLMSRRRCSEFQRMPGLRERKKLATSLDDPRGGHASCSPSTGSPPRRSTPIAEAAGVSRATVFKLLPDQGGDRLRRRRGGGRRARGATARACPPTSRPSRSLHAWLGDLGGWLEPELDPPLHPGREVPAPSGPGDCSSTATSRHVIADRARDRAGAGQASRRPPLRPQSLIADARHRRGGRGRPHGAGLSRETHRRPRSIASSTTPWPSSTPASPPSRRAERLTVAVRRPADPYTGRILQSLGADMSPLAGAATTRAHLRRVVRRDLRHLDRGAAPLRPGPEQRRIRPRYRRRHARPAWRAVRDLPRDHQHRHRGRAVAIAGRQSETMALSYVASRVVESIIIVVGLISLLSVVTLREESADPARMPAHIPSPASRWSPSTTGRSSSVSASASVSTGCCSATCSTGRGSCRGGWRCSVSSAAP